MRQHEIVVLLTLVLYKIVLVGLGLIARTRTKDEADFFLGGRRLGPWVAAISASASSSSAWTLLGVSGAAYRWGLGAVWLLPACVGGFALNWYLLAPGLQAHSHQSGALTTTEVLAPPEQGRSRVLTVRVASCIILLSLVTYIASQFQGAGKTFAETFGLSMQSSILIGSAIVLLYTLLGGFWAVSLTDTLQGLMMAVASLVLPVVALFSVGGIGGLWTGMKAVAVPGFLDVFRDLDTLAGLGFALALLGIGLGYPGQPHVVNRFMALVHDGGQALKRGRRIALGWALIVYSGMLLLGWCGRLLLPELGDQEVVFVAATHTLLSPILAGVVLAAVLSAIMSTADSQLLVAASTVSYDLGVGRHRSLSWESRVRWAIVLLSMAAVTTALWGSQEIFSKVLFAWSAMGCAFGPLLLVIVRRGPVPQAYTLASMLAGFFLSVGAYLFAPTRGGIMERILPFGVAWLIAEIGSRKARTRVLGGGQEAPA